MKFWDTPRGSTLSFMAIWTSIILLSAGFWYAVISVVLYAERHCN